ncbi:MAG: EamA family transporter RarD [Chloroflexota bacterium]
MNKGTWYALSAYTLWGLLPIYWKWLAAVPALEILAHRVVWSLLFLLAILSYRRYWQWLPLLKEWRVAATFLATTILLFINWYVFIWAINAGYIVEASLGYFINPLVNVLLGMLFLGERLRQWQWLAIGFALLGVGYLTISYGSLPWIGLTLAFSFGFYGLLRKTAKLDALAGLSTETAVLLLPAPAYLFWLEGQQTAAFLHSDATTNFLLLFAGVVTAIPLLLFSLGARRVTMTTLGILQYIAPTLQFMLGVYVYGEAFTTERLIGFAFIWTALAIYTLELFINGRRQRQLAYGD